MNTDSPLFGSWLSETRKLQAEAYGRDLWGIEGVEKAESITRDFAEVVIELGEMMNEYPGHKSWVIDRTVIDREKFIREGVDALHFLANMLTSVQCTDEELTEYYLEKMQKNRDRQTSGTYDGVHDKCPHCHRELDDVLLSDGTVQHYVGSCPEHGLVGGNHGS